MPSLAPLTRGLAGRCPNCGEAGVLRGVWEIADECPACHYGFVREDGYWVGAMTVLTALILVAFTATVGVGAWMTWPDVPVLGLTVASFVVTLLVGALAYSWSKTIWVGLDLAFTPATAVEQAEMETRRAAADRAAADGATGERATTERD